MIPEEPKFKIGDTVVLKRRWFLWFREYVLCEIVGGRYVTHESETDIPTWRYTLKVGNQYRRFCCWESELFFVEEKFEECRKRGGKYRRNIDNDVFCKLEGKEEYKM